ncbi:hypothetical protein ACHAW6_007515, partial [Cyclotella cf. meneghiniana]
DVDGNCGSRKRGKKGGDNHKNRKKKKASVTNAELSGNEDNAALPDGCEMDGDWMFIKSGRISSYLPYLTATTPIQYWWNDEDGWLHATILKSIYKVVTSKIIKWVVKVEFEDGEQISLAFHPADKRWKVKIGDVADKREEENRVGKSGIGKRGGIASDKKRANPPSLWKEDEKNLWSESSANAGDGASEAVKSSAKANASGDHVKKSEPTDLGLFFKKDSTKAGSSGSGTLNLSKPDDLGLSLKNDGDKARSTGIRVSKSEPADLGLLTKNGSAKASNNSLTANASKLTDLSWLTRNVDAKAISSSGTVTPSKPTDLGLLTKNVTTKARSSGGTVTPSQPTDLGLLTKDVSTKGTLTPSQPTDLGLLTKDVSTKSSSSGGTLTPGKPVSTEARRSSGTVATSEPTDLTLLTKNVSTEARRSSGTVATSEPTDLTLLTQNVSTKASNNDDGASKKSKPISMIIHSHSLSSRRNTNSDTSTSIKIKQIGNQNTTPLAKKKEPVPIIDNMYKSDKSTINTVTPFRHTTQKPAAAANKPASFSLPSNTQFKLKQVASKMAKETEESNASFLAERIDRLETARVMAVSKKKSHRPTSTIDLTTKPTGEKKTEAKAISKETSANRSRPMTLTESLYEKQSTKAEEFVNHMKRRDDMAASTKNPSVTSPGGSVSSSASAELDVTVDRQRKELFTTGVSKVMTRLHIEKMDVEELMTKLNAYTCSQKQEPFTPLEARTFLQQLDSQKCIFMVWSEGTSGVVYSCSD